MPISDWDDMLTETVGITPPSTKDKWKNVTVGANVNYDARVVTKNVLVRNAANEMVMSKVQVWLELAVIPDHNAVVTLPTAYSPRTPPIQSIESYGDESGGVHHVKVFL